MRLLRRFLLLALCAATVLSSVPAKASLFIIPDAIAMLLGSPDPRLSDVGVDMVFAANRLPIGINIVVAALGVVILDERTGNVQVQPLNSSLAAAAGITKDELSEYNSQENLATLTLVLNETRQEQQHSNASVEKAHARLVESARQEMSPLAFSAYQKIKNTWTLLNGGQ